MDKKKWIIVVIIIFVVVGIVEWKSNKNYQTDASKVSNIVIADTADNVKIRISDDNMIHVSYFEGISYKYNIDMKDDTLEITGNNRAPINLDLQNASLVIEIPKTYERNIEINTEKGCSVDESLKFKEIKINASEN